MIAPVPCASTFAAIYHDAGTEFFGNLANDGSVTPVGSGQANCCKVYAGVFARNANRLRFVGGDLGSSAARLFEVNTATGVFSEIGALNAAYVIHGLLESNVNLASDALARLDGRLTAASQAGIASEAAARACATGKCSPS